MTLLTRQALRHLETHRGIATASTLAATGMSPHAIRQLVDAGTLEPVLDGAYRVTAVPLDELARCAAVCAAHPDVVIAGPTAGRLWGFRRLPRDRRVHVIAPPASHPTIASWVRAYRTAAIHPDDVVVRPDGIRVTSRARTALDLSRVVPRPDALSIVEQAMHDGDLSEEDLRRVALDWVTPGRPWVRRFLLLLDGRVAGGGAESHGEVVLGDALVAAGMRGLRRQHAVDLPGYGPARFDLAVPAVLLDIEVDLFPTHRETEGRRRDAWRDRCSAEAGWLVRRVLERDLGANLERTAHDLVRLAADRRVTRSRER